MKIQVFFVLSFVFGALFCLPEAAGQANPASPGAKPPAATTGDKLKPLPVATDQCSDCKHALPMEIHSSTKNAVAISGPPDGKGKPVEYQVFTQSKTDKSWKLEAAGRISEPGSKASFKYYRPAQMLVLIYCESPCATNVEFSEAKMAPPAKKVKETDCTACNCETCQHKRPTAVFSSAHNNVTVSGPDDSKGSPVEYQIFTQAKDNTWKAEKSGIVSKKGEKGVTCLSKPSQVLVLVYGENPKDASVKFAPAVCNK